MFQNIICAIDGSEHSTRAAEIASNLAAKLGSKLTFLTVSKELKMTAKLKRYIEIEHLAGEPQYVLDEYTESVLDQAMVAARAAGVANAKTEVRTGQPARVIVNFADRNDADCIVMGSRGHGDIEAMLLGSVSHKVTSLSKCTVIAVK